VYVHGLLVSDELDPSLDVWHRVGRCLQVVICVVARAGRTFSSDSAQGGGGYAHAWSWGG
jgi:hypothetical protein